MADLGLLPMNNSAEILNRNPALKKAFFDLGWDYYAARQGMPDDAMDYQCFVDGYEAAKGRIHHERGDRFELKLLQIRYGALKRNRIIDETVTADVLRRIDVKRCPVTKQLLTHSTFTESDWSVERVRNDSGYTVGNLIVVSTKANRAKGTMSHDDIKAIVQGGESYNGLTTIEWSRWQLLTSLNVSKIVDGKSSVGYCCAPYVVECPNMMIMNPSAALQHAIATKAVPFRKCGMYAQLVAGLPKSVRQELNSIVNDAVKCRSMVRSEPFEIWHMPKLFNRFKNLYGSLTHEHKYLVARNFYKDSDVRGEQVHTDLPAWSPELRGYNN
jgi:hypothetical protein